MSEGEEDPIGYALDNCISENLLSDYFEKLKREDRGMIFGEYSYEDDIRVQRQEAFEEGQEAGIEKGAQAKAIENARSFYANGVSLEIIAKSLNMPIEKVKEIVSKTEVTSS